MKFTNASALAVVPVSEVAAGTYVRKIAVCKACNGDGCTEKGLCDVCQTLGYTAQATTYVRNHYDRSAKKYSLTGFYDSNHETFITGKTRVQVGFSF